MGKRAPRGTWSGHEHAPNKHAKVNCCLLTRQIRRLSLPHQTLLGHGRYDDTFARVDATAAKSARAVARGAVHGIEQPFIGAERPVEPQRMVEASELDIGIEHELAMGDQCGVEQGEVGCVRQHTLVQWERLG